MTDLFSDRWFVGQHLIAVAQFPHTTARRPVVVTAVDLRGVTVAAADDPDVTQRFTLAGEYPTAYMAKTWLETPDGVPA